MEHFLSRGGRHGDLQAQPDVPGQRGPDRRGRRAALRRRRSPCASWPRPAPPPPPRRRQPTSYNTRQQLRHHRLRAAHARADRRDAQFITKRLDEKRGIVLLVYVEGATDDMEMLAYFNDVKAKYAADSSFFSFEARESKQLGDMLAQLRVSDPPILAIIRGDGTGRPALHRLDRRQGHGAGRRRRGARPLGGRAHACRLPTAPLAGAVFCLTAPAPCGTIMPTYWLGFGIDRRTERHAHLIALRIRPAGHGVPGRRTTSGRPVPLPEIAAGEGIPAPFLERILARLREAGLVKATRGVSGGYQLARAAADIAVGDVVTALEGPLSLVGCVPDDGGLRARRVVRVARRVAPPGQRHQRRPQRHHPGGSHKGGSVTDEDACTSTTRRPRRSTRASSRRCCRSSRERLRQPVGAAPAGPRGARGRRRGARPGRRRARRRRARRSSSPPAAPSRTTSRSSAISQRFEPGHLIVERDRAPGRHGGGARPEPRRLGGRLRARRRGRHRRPGRLRAAPSATTRGSPRSCSPTTSSARCSRSPSWRASPTRRAPLFHTDAVQAVGSRAGRRAASSASTCSASPATSSTGPRASARST